MQGWRISIIASNDDEHQGVTVTASKLGQRTVEVSGGSVADIAVDVVTAATQGE